MLLTSAPQLISDSFGVPPQGIGPSALLPAAVVGSGSLAASSPLSSLPQLSSDPSATAKLYLDFNGHFESRWGTYTNANTPVYDQDGDPTTFSTGEIASIQEIWARVAEDYAPFNIDVTTIDPGTQADRVAAVIAIGGGWADWYGNSSGGVSYVGGFSNTAPNVGYVFENDLGNGNPKYVAEAAAHEAGHLFGLQHQASWSGSTLTAEYNPGNGDWAPIMGVGYSAERTTWYNGPTTAGPTSSQDDLAIIASGTNGFGYKPDDFGNTIATASPLPAVGTSVNFAGLIGQNSDTDAWSFSTLGGAINFQLSGAQLGTDLDGVLELRNSAGQTIATAAPTDSLGANLSATVGAGTYYLLAHSNGDYGDLGQYRITGTLPLVSTVPEITVRAGSTNLTDGQTINLGSTTVGSPLTQTITVVNDGTASLVLASIDAGSLPAGLSLVANLGLTTLAPGQSTTFTVRLDASAAGTISGRLALASNDADENPFDLTFTGTVNSVTSGSTAAALYHFDETSGTTAVDSSGNGNSAVFINGPALGQAGVSAGETAVGFNGINQYVALPDTPFGAYGNAVSFETWFNAPAGASGVILSQTGAGATPGSGSVNGYVPAVQLGTDGRIRSSLFWHGSVNSRIESPGATTYNDGNWHHVAVSFANGVETLYIDGAKAGEQSVANYAYASSYSYFLGTGYTPSWSAGNNGWHYFQGKLDETGIYQRALTATEVSQHFAAGGGVTQPPPVDGPAAYYRFDEASGTVAVDSSGHGNNATYNNGATLGQPGAPSSAADTSASFNGANQYVSIPSTPFGTYGGTLSFETWFNATPGTSGVILSQAGGGATAGGGAPNGYVPMVALGTDGKIRSSIDWHGSVNSRIASPGSMTYNDGNWHHVAVTYANGVESLYLDGALAGQQSVGNYAYAGSYNYFLGTGYTASWDAGNNGWHFFNGKLDEAAIYQRVLSPTEIAAHYAGGSIAAQPLDAEGALPSADAIPLLTSGAAGSNSSAAATDAVFAGGQSAAEADDARLVGSAGRLRGASLLGLHDQAAHNCAAHDAALEALLGDDLTPDDFLLP